MTNTNEWPKVVKLLDTHLACELRAGHLLNLGGECVEVVSVSRPIPGTAVILLTDGTSIAGDAGEELHVWRRA